MDLRHDNLPVSGWFDAAYWRALNPSCTVTESAELGGAGPAQLPTPILQHMSVFTPRLVALLGRSGALSLPSLGAPAPCRYPACLRPC